MTITPSLLDEQLDRLRRAEAADYHGYRAFGSALLQLPMADEQTRWCEAAIACHPQDDAAYLGIADAWAYAGMGRRASMLGFTRLAIGILERALTVAVPSERRHQVHANLAFLYNEIRRHDLAERHARLAEGASNHMYQMWLVEALFEQGRFVNDSLCAVDLSVFSRDRMQSIADQAVAEWNAAPLAPSGDHVLLISVDMTYFELFGVAQVISAHRVGSRVGFHFHIVNPDDRANGIIAALRARFPDVRLTFTAVRIEDIGAQSSRVYYACARLLVARQVMRMSGANVVIADADLLFRARPEELLSSVGDHHLACIHYLGEPLCNRYNASFFAIRRSLESVLFLRVMEAFLEDCFRKGMIWMIDQIALYCCAVRTAAVTGGALRTLLWPEAVVSIHHYPVSDLWAGMPDAPIWSGATTAKWRDTPYVRFRRQLLEEEGFPCR